LTPAIAQTLAGKTALVTGASSGIGQAAALTLAQAGARVAVAARRGDRLAELVSRIEASGGEAAALPGDVTDECFAASAVDGTLDCFGRLDILVNSAGMIQAGGVVGADIEQWRRVIDVNLMAMLYTCRAAIAPMKAQGGGDIINVSSTAGRRASGPFGAYATSKFGLTALTEGLRNEVGAESIRVCVLEPGATKTEVAEGIVDPDVRLAIRRHVSRDGAMSPEDVAAAIMFVVTLPPRANVSQLMIRPTSDVDPN
jgi:NADP-dependent 3-hydroxy acid dehydrogenase YdfG